MLYLTIDWHSMQHTLQMTKVNGRIGGTVGGVLFGLLAACQFSSIVHNSKLFGGF